MKHSGTFHLSSSSGQNTKINQQHPSDRNFQIFELTKTRPVFLTDPSDLKPELLSVLNSLNSVDPLRVGCDLTSMIHAIQPMLMYEAILRPTSDLVRYFESR